MIIYFDYDGVFGNTMAPAIEEMKALGLYDTEEGRTKYFRELDWSKFLPKAGFMENAIETINTLMEKGYTVKFLTHVNSLQEHIDKINFIKSIEGIKNTKDIDVIAIPRKIDKAFAIDPKGNILIDDSPKNIEAWETAGGKGILYSDKENLSYTTINDLSKTINIASVVRKALVNNEESSRNDMLDKIAKMIKIYKNRIHAFLIYDKLVNDEHIVDNNYDAVGSAKLKECMMLYYNLAGGKGFGMPTIIYEDVQKFFSLILHIDQNIKSEKFIEIKNEVNDFYRSDSNIEKQNQYESQHGISCHMEGQPVYNGVYNNIKWREYFESKGEAVQGGFSL